MLCDLAVRKLSPGTSSGSSGPRQSSSGTSSNSSRRLRRPVTRSSTADTDDGECAIHINVHGQDFLHPALHILIFKSKRDSAKNQEKKDIFCIFAVAVIIERILS